MTNNHQPNQSAEERFAEYSNETQRFMTITTAVDSLSRAVFQLSSKESRAFETSTSNKRTREAAEFESIAGQALADLKNEDQGAVIHAFNPEREDGQEPVKPATVNVPPNVVYPEDARRQHPVVERKDLDVDLARDQVKRSFDDEIAA